MKAALWYWTKVTLVILPWATLAALLKVYGYASPIVAQVIGVGGGLLSVWAIVGHIPEVAAMLACRGCLSDHDPLDCPGRKK